MMSGVRTGWLVIGVLASIPLWYLTLAISAGRSCGAYNSGPDTEAQRAFCGEPGAGYSLQFHLVQVIPAVILIVGAFVAYRKSRGAPLLVSFILAVVATLTIWALIP
jgi:hypothetical protein